MYRILGVPKNASTEEIKKAYKALAKEWHPDKNRDNPDLAKKKFQEISEAYEILSNPDKRAIYDAENEPRRHDIPHRPNFHNMSNQQPFDNIQNLMNLFQMGINTPVTSSASSPETYELFCTLEELYNGCTKRIHFHKNIDVQVRKGWKDGTKLTYDEVKIVIIREKPHNVFTREKDNLVIWKDISLEEAKTGTTITIKLLSKEIKTVTTKPLAYSDDCFVVSNCGMPTKNGTFGDLKIKFRIKL